MAYWTFEDHGGEGGDAEPLWKTNVRVKSGQGMTSDVEKVKMEEWRVLLSKGNMDVVGFEKEFRWRAARSARGQGLGPWSLALAFESCLVRGSP